MVTGASYRLVVTFGVVVVDEFAPTERQAIMDYLKLLVADIDPAGVLGAIGVACFHVSKADGSGDEIITIGPVRTPAPANGDRTSGGGGPTVDSGVLAPGRMEADSIGPAELLQSGPPNAGGLLNPSVDENSC